MSLREIDPTNRLLARQNRYRLEAELVRDQILAASGLLNCRIGGPGFRPPLTKRLSDIGFRFAWNSDAGAELLRRGMYIFFQRNLMYPTLMTFDHPRSNVTCTRRERSNTPLQALTLLNHPTFVEAAKALAVRVLSEVASDTVTFKKFDLSKRSIHRVPLTKTERSPDKPPVAAFKELDNYRWKIGRVPLTKTERSNNKPPVAVRMEHALFLCLARPPNDQERRVLVDLYHRLHRIHRQDASLVRALLGDCHVRRIDDAELATWIAVVRTMMNLDEFITRE